MPLEPFDIEDEVRYQIPDHRVLLCFHNDSGAEWFREWMCSEGGEAFEQWVARQTQPVAEQGDPDRYGE